jgi:threonine dehydrogenase-like Zn-dependent dehydrogenase
LRVRNIQCGICSSDLSLLLLKVDPSIAPAALPSTDRFYLGHEVVGEVVEVGDQVTRFRVGDRVVMESRFEGPHCFNQEITPPCRQCAAGQTRLCENTALNRGPAGFGGGWGDGYLAHETDVWPVPEELDNDQASLIEPFSVAIHTVLRRPPKPKDHVLVIGAGIVGLLTIQAVRVISPDCHLTVLARYPHQVEAARRFGADEVLTDGDLYDELSRITKAKYYRAPLNRGILLGGFEMIYDCVGNQRTITDSLRWARAQGTVVIVGVHLSQLKVDLNPIWYQEVDLIGTYAHGHDTWNGRQAHTFEFVIQLMKEGKLEHQGLITHRFPFDQYRQAIATSMDKRTGAIKVVFTYHQR